MRYRYHQIIHRTHHKTDMTRQDTIPPIQNHQCDTNNTQNHQYDTSTPIPQCKENKTMSKVEGPSHGFTTISNYPFIVRRAKIALALPHSKPRPSPLINPIISNNNNAPSYPNLNSSPHSSFPPFSQFTINLNSPLPVQPF